ncbi:MinD/ParA family protein [Methanolobus sp. WCC1]|jgi:septum site-determining protein MinD|uniref:ATPase involved in chromosome partitioning n=2 Tax=Methanolobus TaxID=2220 RepID=W9DNH0_METTI|nr:MinD/ParA family protein [Methanolobus tindarius]ETA67609.1 ATPase involved in chromosome partitioning [Methanolobus tindarius DSM 2278]
MTLTLAIHSSKGGTGKTSIAMNLAVAFASTGKNTCLIDLDLRGPSLCSMFEPKTHFWINDFLSGKCNINDTLTDVKGEMGTEAHMYLSFSNPDIREIRDLVSKDRDWQASALKALMNGKRELSEKDLDVIIFDTSPGVEYESINAVAASDMVIIVHNDTNACTSCTEQLINGVYSLLDKKCGIIDNMSHRNIIDIIDTKRYGVPVLATIPCMCEIATRSKDEILVHTEPEHLFSKSIFSIKEKIEAMK